MRAFRFAILLSVAAALAACSGSGGSVDRSIMRINLGTTTMSNLLQYSELTLLTTYSFRFERSEATSPDNIFLLTEWKDGIPTEDEQALGIQFVRTRITVTGRTSNRTTGDIRARMVCEAQYRMASGLNWVDAPMSREREAYFDDIVDYLKRQLRSAWRQ